MVIRVVMNKHLVVANWKMNGSLAMLAAHAKANYCSDRTDIVVLPPAVYLHPLRQMTDPRLQLGVQDISEWQGGAYTGDVAAAMASECGAQWALMGHSERRAGYAESDQKVAQKLHQALAAGLQPIVCVGETAAQRQAGNAYDAVAGQIDAVIADIDATDELVVAYEPIWAIGTGASATPQDANDMHGFIRQRIRASKGAIADKVRILYGGSVNADNVAALFAMSEVQGALVGGASLNADDFAALIAAAERF